MVTKLFRRRKLCDCRREILLLMEHCFSFECFPLATIVFFFSKSTFIGKIAKILFLKVKKF